MEKRVPVLWGNVSVVVTLNMITLLTTEALRPIAIPSRISWGSIITLLSLLAVTYFSLKRFPLFLAHPWEHYADRSFNGIDRDDHGSSYVFGPYKRIFWRITALAYHPPELKLISLSHNFSSPFAIVYDSEARCFVVYDQPQRGPLTQTIQSTIMLIVVNTLLFLGGRVVQKDKIAAEGFLVVIFLMSATLPSIVRRVASVHLSKPYVGISENIAQNILVSPMVSRASAWIVPRRAIVCYPKIHQHSTVTRRYIIAHEAGHLEAGHMPKIIRYWVITLVLDGVMLGGVFFVSASLWLKWLIFIGIVIGKTLIGTRRMWRLEFEADDAAVKLTSYEEVVEGLKNSPKVPGDFSPSIRSRLKYLAAHNAELDKGPKSTTPS